MVFGGQESGETYYGDLPHYFKREKETIPSTNPPGPFFASSAPPSVKVPVLSLQITDAEPKVSTAAIFRTWPGTFTDVNMPKTTWERLMVQWCLSEAENYGVTRVNNHTNN